MAIGIVEKVCRRCKILKLLKDFGAQKRNKDGREAQCLECVNTYRRNRWKANINPDKARNQHLWIRYQIRPEEYESLLQSQRGICAICGQPPSIKEKYLRVDHCHETDLIRGLLCAACNMGLGSLGDTIKGVEQALEYLKRVKENPPVQPTRIVKPVIQGKAHHWYGQTSLAPRGIDHPNVILNEEKVRKILVDWKSGSVTQGQLARANGVSSATIQKIVQRKLWKHITIDG